jgi:hypothetical protein
LFLHETLSAASDRLRQRWVRLACASSLALAALTAAHAAVRLPGPAPAQAAPVVQAARPILAAAPEPPPPLLAFSEPVPGHPVNSPFGLRRLPWETHGRLHEGVDIAAPTGMPVVAAADGLIARAGRSDTYGTFVEIRHAGGLRTFYAHLGRLAPRAEAGTFVRAGTLIAQIGNSGTSTGPHLHFEIRREDDRPLNPVAFIGKSFEDLADLPLQKAAKVPRKVHIAYVSEIPESKRALMAAREAGLQPPLKDKGGRVRVRLELPASVAPAEDQPAATAAADPLIEVIEG